VARIGWIVDCQVDFMEPEGRLYVKDLGDDSDPGAREIQDRLVEAVAWMRGNCDVLVFTGDWHGYDDEEIDADSPDPDRGTYPPHCMGRSDDPRERAGAEIMEPIAPDDPVIVPVDADPEDARGLVGRARDEGRDLFIRKNRFDVFAGNAATERVIAELERVLGGSVEFVVVGVARDVCVTQAIDGMQERGYRTVALKDVTWGLGLEDEEVTVDRWSMRGRVTTLSDLERS